MQPINNTQKKNLIAFIYRTVIWRELVTTRPCAMLKYLTSKVKQKWRLGAQLQFFFYVINPLKGYLSSLDTYVKYDLSVHMVDFTLFLRTNTGDRAVFILRSEEKFLRNSSLKKMQLI